MKEIASGWKEHPALAMTQSFLFVNELCESPATECPPCPVSRAGTGTTAGTGTIAGTGTTAPRAGTGTIAGLYNRVPLLLTVPYPDGTMKPQTSLREKETLDC